MAEPVIALGFGELALAGSVVVLLGGLSLRAGLGLERRLLEASLRMCLQLAVIGLVLEQLFRTVHAGAIAGIALLMVAVAGLEVQRRQKHRLRRRVGTLIGITSMSASCLLIALLALVVIIAPSPWYHPRYAIPLLGMLLGNSMNGIALCLDGLTTAVVERRQLIEARLLLGQPPAEAMRPVHRDCLRTALMPLLNTMSVTGLVSLPGMMTGQILGGSPPLMAVAYQVLIMFLIAGSVGLGSLIALRLGTRHLFDERERLRLDRLPD